MGCRDVTQEVSTPVAWVKELQIDFSDRKDQHTEVCISDYCPNRAELATWSAVTKRSAVFPEDISKMITANMAGFMK